MNKDILSWYYSDIVVHCRVSIRYSYNYVAMQMEFSPDVVDLIQYCLKSSPIHNDWYMYSRQQVQNVIQNENNMNFIILIWIHCEKCIQVKKKTN